jgi:hypothetical protein
MIRSPDGAPAVAKALTGLFTSAPKRSEGGERSDAQSGIQHRLNLLLHFASLHAGYAQQP